MDGTRSLVSGGELMLYGVVDSQAWEGEGIRAIDVIDSLAKVKGSAVTVRINSPGGSVTEGIAIYNALKADGRKIIVRVDAMAASIASVIAMAGDEIIMAEGASIMIHDPWAVTMGSSKELRSMADEIDRLRDIILNIYEKRTGMSRDELSSLMAAETFMGASDAIERGFATHAAEPMKIAACALLDRTILARLIGVQIPSEPAESRPTNAASAVSEKGLTMTTSNEAAVAVAPVVKTIDAEAIRAEAMATERTRVTEITNLVSRLRIDNAVATDLIASGASIEAARAKVLDVLEKAAGPETIPSIRVTRDERETVKAHMTSAIAIQLGAKGDVTDREQPYMGLTLPELAAEYTGYKGRLSTAAQRESVIRNAMHTLSDFDEIFENALNKSLASRYDQASPTYRQIARQRTYNDFRSHITVKAGDFPQLQAVTEGGEIKSGTFSDTKESTAVLPYAVQFSLSRQMLVNDNLGAIQQVIAAQGDSVARFEESTFFDNATFGFRSASEAGPNLNETGRAVFNSTDSTLAGSGAAIDVTTLSTGRAAMRQKTSIDGAKLNISPSILLVGPAYETLAQQIVTSITPALSGSVNPFAGTLTVVVTPYITGNDWYLLAAPSVAPIYEWGLLSGYTAPRLRMEEPFGYQGMSVSLEHDFGFGAIDFRGGWRNPGA